MEEDIREKIISLLDSGSLKQHERYTLEKLLEEGGVDVLSKLFPSNDCKKAIATWTIENDEVSNSLKQTMVETINKKDFDVKLSILAEIQVRDDKKNKRR